jgi:hypothetical protein
MPLHPDIADVSHAELEAMFGESISTKARATRRTGRPTPDYRVVANQRRRIDE